MKAVYAVVLSPVCESGGYVARVPDVNGCITTGTDIQDTLENVRDALAACLCTLEDFSQPFPAPSSTGSLQCASDSIISLVDVDTQKYREEIKSRKKARD